jgi:hypothetical protein
MLIELWFGLRKFSSRRPQRLRSTSRLCLEPLEDRMCLSAGPSAGGAPIPSSGSSGGTGSQPVAIVAGASGTQGTTGGSGTSSVLSGPGYPLAPTTGPARPDPGTLSPPPQTTVLVPMTGTPGGPDPTLTVLPVCTGGGPGSTPAG